MKALVAWSGGKDAAWALHLARQQDVEVAALLTTTAAGRVAMHEVRGALVEAQAAAAGLPLWAVALPWPCPNSEYESAMRASLERARKDGIDAVVFGDLFLAEIRAYRESLLEGTGVRPFFPLWGKDTAALAAQMIAQGLRATVVCVDLRKLSARFAGRDLDAALLADLPEGCDPCGENGEFHTFAWGGPMFRAPVPIARGAVEERGGFAFADLLPAG
ncbi:MAG TPA: hypothetical protein VKH65_10325 [Myxococcales bacterium]|nr:hypothetical protein [Myxococcales bacterium]